MTDQPSIAEGLIEYLQATNPRMATALTMERLSFVVIISRLGRENGELLALVAEALACVGDLMLSFDEAIGEKGTRIPNHQVDRVKDWLARAAPKEEAGDAD